MLARFERSASTAKASSQDVVQDCGELCTSESASPSSHPRGAGENGLSVTQLNAIDLMVLGRRDADVARAVGVHRNTVGNWRRLDPRFQAELNRRRQEIWGASVDRLRGLVA